MEISIETLYIVISLLAVLSAGLTIFVVRQFHFSKNQRPDEKAQTLIQDYQNKIEDSQSVIQDHQSFIQKLQNQLKLKDKRSFQVGQNSSNGRIAEFLGFLGVSLTQKFDILCMLSSTSKKPSVDAIGFNDESITFIEFKKAGAPLTPKENKVKKLVAEGKIVYKIIDVNLPTNLTNDRKVIVKEVNVCRIQK